MFVRVRPAGQADLRQCADSIRDRAQYTERETDRLVSLWTELLAAGACSATLMEKIGAASHGRLLWFSVAVFPTIKFTEALHRSDEPYVARKILRALRDGESPSPLLSAGEIRRANSAEGVNMLVLNSGASEYARPEPVWSDVQNQLLEFNVYHAQGYRLRELMIESYDVSTANWLSTIGLKLRNTYIAQRGAFRAHAEARSAGPALYGCTFDEAREQPGSVIAAMMHYREPVVFFSALEQHLLLHALAGDTDDELATRLNYKMATIRKRWLSIYDKIAEHPSAMEMLPAFLTYKGAVRDRPAASRSPYRRGAEKKRVLLQYLRQHMEELRPARAPVAPWRPSPKSPIAL